jgi:predicted ATPase
MQLSLVVPLFGGLDYLRSLGEAIQAFNRLTEYSVGLGEPHQHDRRTRDTSGMRSAKLLELRASISLARFWCKQGKRGKARDLLAPIYDWFTEGFDTPVLEEAKTLLDELCERRPDLV